MFLYEDIRVNGHQGYVGLISPTIGKLVNGTQVLGADVSANVMTFLQNRYPIVDPTAGAPTAGAPTAEIAKYLAITPEKFVGFGYKVEGVPTAAQQVQSLAAGRVVLVDLGDVETILAAQALASGDFHFAVVDAGAVAKYASTGAAYGMLATGGAGVPATETATTTISPIIPPLVGGGIGFLVAGPIGAAIGVGLGLGYDYLQTAKKA